MIIINWKETVLYYMCQYWYNIGRWEMIPYVFNDFVHVGSSFAVIKFLCPHSLKDYILQIIDQVFNVDNVTGDDIIKIMG